MKAHIKLGRIFGVAIGLHYSWIIIALLVTLSLRAQFAMEHPNWNGSTTWSIAIITGLLFFVSILLHELSHAAVAKLRGIPVRAITLFALGGVAQIEKDAADAKSEFWMGIIGPISSIVIGVVCLAVAWLLGWNFSAKTPLAYYGDVYVAGLHQHRPCHFQHDSRISAGRWNVSCVPWCGGSQEMRTVLLA